MSELNKLFEFDNWVNTSSTAKSPVAIDSIFKSNISFLIISKNNICTIGMLFNNIRKLLVSSSS